MNNSDIKEQVIATLKTCYDPEIPVNIYDLGLIYGIDIDDHNNVNIRMTLTSPNCPAIETLPEDIQEKLQTLKEIELVNIELVWDPPFSQDLMSDEARLALGLL